MATATLEHLDLAESDKDNYGCEADDLSPVHMLVWPLPQPRRRHISLPSQQQHQLLHPSPLCVQPLCSLGGQCAHPREQRFLSSATSSKPSYVFNNPPGLLLPTSRWPLVQSRDDSFEELERHTSSSWRVRDSFSSLGRRPLPVRSQRPWFASGVHDPSSRARRHWPERYGSCLSEADSKRNSVTLRFMGRSLFVKTVIARQQFFSFRLLFIYDSVFHCSSDTVWCVKFK